MQTKEINVLVLAYLGDTIYENYIRRFLINRGIGNVNDLQKEAIISSLSYVATGLIIGKFVTSFTTLMLSNV